MLFFLKQREDAVGVSSNKLVQSHTVSPFWRTSTLHPEKIHVSHGQQDQLCQQKCSVPCSGPPLPNDLPENPRNRGLKWGKSQGLQGVPTVELWNWGTVEPESPSPSPLRGWTGSHHREESKEFGLGKALRVEEVDVLMGTGNWGGSQLNQQTSPPC